MLKKQVNPGLACVKAFVTSYIRSFKFDDLALKSYTCFKVLGTASASMELGYCSNWSWVKMKTWFRIFHDVKKYLPNFNTRFRLWLFLLSFLPHHGQIHFFLEMPWNWGERYHKKGFKITNCREIGSKKVVF